MCHFIALHGQRHGIGWLYVCMYFCQNVASKLIASCFFFGYIFYIVYSCYASSIEMAHVAGELSLVCSNSSACERQSLELVNVDSVQMDCDALNACYQHDVLIDAGRNVDITCDLSMYYTYCFLFLRCDEIAKLMIKQIKKTSKLALFGH